VPKRDVLGEELYERSLCVETESVVGEIDGVEVWEREESTEEMLKCRGDFREEAGCEDVCEVCDLRRLVLAKCSMYSLLPARKESFSI
jgi:hypothetical protein